MRKKLELLLVFILFTIPILGIKYSYDKYYNSDTYYTKISRSGQQIKEQDAEKSTVDYRYHQVAYSKSGKPKEVDFTGDKPRPFKRNTYLKLTVHDKKGVTMWEEIDDEQLPKKVQKKLD